MKMADSDGKNSEYEFNKVLGENEKKMYIFI